MSITNNSGTTITIDRLFAHWVQAPSSQKIDRLFLNGSPIWNTSDPNSPSDIPAEGGGSWPGVASDRAIPNANSGNFVIQFQFPLEPGNYEVHIVFNALGCQVSSGPVTLP